MSTTKALPRVRTSNGALPARAATTTETAEWRVLGAITVALLIITTVPYVFAHQVTPPGMRFMGIMLGVPDHAQYFSWMRDLSHSLLAANRLTPEPNAPALFNLLWWGLGRIGVLTGLDYAALFSLVRVAAIISCMGCAYGFFRLVIAKAAHRRLATVLFAFGGGLGTIWVIAKYLLRLKELPFPLDVYVVEANTFAIMLAFPHFTLALALMIATIGLFLLALRRRHYLYAAAAGIAALLLSLQHAYDLITIYAVLGLFGLLVWVRDRKFPTFPFACGIIVIALSAPFAAYLFVLVKADPIWGAVLAQFDNAGVFTPQPHHLLVLLGVPFLLSLAVFRPRMLQSRDDGELLVAAWFVAHFPLVYLPVDFQIHLLLGWQVPIAVLGAAGLMRYGPVLAQRLRLRPRFVIAGLVGLAVVTNVYLVAWRLVDLKRIEPPYYMTVDEVAALDWLAAHTSNKDVVLSNLRFGQFVPMWSDARAFLAHWANTLNYYEKQEKAGAVLNPATSDDTRLAVVRAYAVTYVVASPEQTGPPTPLHVPYLIPVFTQGPVAVYRVEAKP